MGIRSNPEQAESLYGKFEKIVEEEEEEKDQDGSGAKLSPQPPLLRYQGSLASSDNVPTEDIGRSGQDLKGAAWTAVGDASSLEIEDDQGGEMESASQLDVQGAPWTAVGDASS